MIKNKIEKSVRRPKTSLGKAARYVIGLDYGTNSVRALVVNADQPIVKTCLGLSAAEPELAAYALAKLFLLGNRLTTETDGELAALGPQSSITQEAVQRFDALNHRLQKHQQRAERLQRQRAELRREAGTRRQPSAVGQPEALHLLEEELACPGGALVARVNRRDAPVAVQGVDEKGLAAGADDSLQVLAAAVEVDKGLLHGLGL